MSFSINALASLLFPLEKWYEFYPCIYVAKSRIPKNKTQKEIFNKELNMAKILVKYKHKIYMLPEIGGDKHPDAIMDNDTIEFKEVTGSINKIGERFREALKQANNVFINVKLIGISQNQVHSKLIGKVKTLLENKSKINSTGCVYIYMNGELLYWKIKDLIDMVK